MAVVTYQGERYIFDLEKISIDEWREIKRKLKLTIRQFMDGLTDLDPDALTGLYWLVMRSGGKHDELPLAADLQFDVMAFAQAWAGADEAAEVEEAADPTVAREGSSTLLSPGSSTTTSEPSATSISSRSPAAADSEPVMSGA